MVVLIYIFIIKLNPSRNTSDFLGSSIGKESASNADLGSIPGLGRSLGEGPLQYSGLENSTDYISMGLQRVGND